MKAHSIRLELESLEDRCVPSTVPYDFNNDGLEDKMAITSPTTITVSLANPDGSYTVSAILTAPKSQPITDGQLGHVQVSDVNGDGNLDITNYVSTGDRFRYYNHEWLGNGDGTFGNRHTEKGIAVEW